MYKYEFSEDRYSKILPLTPYEGKEKLLNNLLHPDNKQEFTSNIFGKISSLSIMMILLNKGPKYFNYLDTTPDKETLEYLKTHKSHHTEYYWKIITLVMLEYLVSDKELIASILDMSNKVKVSYNIQAYTVVRRNNIKYTQLDKSLRSYAISLKYLINEITNIFDYKTFSNLDDKEYKRKVRELKEIVFDKAIKKIKYNKIMTDISDINNDAIRMKYLGRKI